MANLALALLVPAILWAQQPPAPPPPPPRPPAPNPAARLPEIRNRLDATKPANTAALRALQSSRQFLNSAEKALRSRQSFAADRFAAAAGALLHVAEHQQHLETGGGPKGPPEPAAIRDHLQRVYFRVQQAEYFYEQAHDPRAASFPEWARDFYQLAVRAYDHQNFVAADEDAKSAEEVVMALENLAQAAAPAKIPVPPPPPPPPRPPY